MWEALPKEMTLKVRLVKFKAGVVNKFKKFQ